MDGRSVAALVAVAVLTVTVFATETETDEDPEAFVHVLRVPHENGDAVFAYAMHPSGEADAEAILGLFSALDTAGCRSVNIDSRESPGNDLERLPLDTPV